MKPLFLIACSARKGPAAAPARDLYTGQAFGLALEAAARSGADVLILSALHGAVEPSRVLEPYDRTLSALPAFERARWAQETADQLRHHRHRPAVVLAGKHYAAAAVLAGFESLALPLAGLGIGQQLHALKHWGQA